MWRCKRPQSTNRVHRGHRQRGSAMLLVLICLILSSLLYQEAMSQLLLAKALCQHFEHNSLLCGKNRGIKSRCRDGPGAI